MGLLIISLGLNNRTHPLPDTISWDFLCYGGVKSG